MLKSEGRNKLILGTERSAKYETDLDLAAVRRTDTVTGGPRPGRSVRAGNGGGLAEGKGYPDRWPERQSESRFRPNPGGAGCNPDPALRWYRGYGPKRRLLPHHLSLHRCSRLGHALCRLLCREKADGRLWQQTIWPQWPGDPICGLHRHAPVSGLPGQPVELRHRLW